MIDDIQTILNVSGTSTNRSYPIFLGVKALEESCFGQWIECLESKPTKALVVTDSNCISYKTSLVSLLKAYFIDVSVAVIPEGEKNKSMDYLVEILNSLAKGGFTRNDMIFAFGGGVIGDLAGFAASIYMRGIRFVQIPTSLLAMVDSSVGGKVAIDFDEKKNLVGNFWNPTAVFADLDYLETLPKNQWREGIGEIVKCLLLLEWENYSQTAPIGLFEKMRKDPEQLFNIIKTCVEFKRSVVENDLFEQKDGVESRKILNFGHTLGHAIETLTNFEISHGKAVMLGIVGALGFARQNDLLSEQEFETVKGLIQLCYGPLYVNDIGILEHINKTPQEYANVIKSDKKASGNSIDIVLPSTLCKRFDAENPTRFPSVSFCNLENDFVVPALKVLLG